MKALSLVGVALAIFFIFLGIASRATAGVLSNAVIVMGAIIIIFVCLVWTITLVKEKRKKENKTDF